MLKDKKILITGGAGFIGSHIVEEFVKEEARVFVIDNLIHDKNLIPNEIMHKIEFWKVDIRHYKELAVLASLCNFDYIIHLAALISVPESVNYPQKYFDVNVNGSLNVLNIAKNYNVKKLIIASSSAVYGNNGGLFQSEINPISPMSPYAKTKSIIEGVSDFYQTNNLQIFNFRFFNVYGPRQRVVGDGAVIPTFIKKLLAYKNGVTNSIPTIYGNGNQSRDFCFIKDVANALKNTLHYDVEGGIFNIGSGADYTINALLSLLQAQVGTEITPLTAPNRPGDLKNSVASIYKAGCILLFNPIYSLTRGLQETIEWYKDNE